MFNSVQSYMIVRRRGISLEEYFIKQGQNLTLESVCSIGKKLLSLLKDLHETGIVYNDIKPSNIILDFLDNASARGMCQRDQIENCHFYLSNFGCATKFRNSDGKLKKKKRIPVFNGNTIFASHSQMSFFSTSRRDDLISMSYLLLYLLNNGEPKGLDHISNVYQ